MKKILYFLGTYLNLLRSLSWWIWIWIFGIFAVLAVFVWRTPLGIIAGNSFFGGSDFYSTTLAEYAYAWAGFRQYPIQLLSYQRGRIAFIEGRFDTAIWFFEKELEYFSNTDQAYYMLGLTYGYTHREFKGIEAFTTFIERHPDNWPSRNDLAWLYFRVGALEEAYRTILPAAQLYGGTPWVENTYGVMLLNKGMKKEAHDAFQRGLATLNLMTNEDWGIAYPGNDPRVYEQGLEQMKQSFLENIELAKL
jgi:tetratricopeptide (TPR) repeat protein